MTAPYSFQPLPVPSGIQPGPFQPGPTGGDYLQQGAGDLGKVLMALRQLSQTSQLENRQLDVQQQLGMGNLGQQRAELGQRVAEKTYEQQQDTQKQTLAAEALRRQAMAGKGLRQMLSARGVTGLDQVPDENVVGLVPELEKAGVIGPLTDAERRLTTFVDKYQGTPNEGVGRDFLGPPKPNQITVNNIGQNEHAKAIAGVAGDLYKTALTDAQSALRLMPSITGARGLVDKSFTGLGANAKLNAARLLNFFKRPGDDLVISNDPVTDTQTLKRLAQENTLAFLGTRALGSGTAVSDKDREYMQSLSGENITLEPSALKRIFRINYGAQIMKVQDAVNELRQQAIDYPDDAAQLTRRAAALEANLRSKWVEYGAMLQEEKKAESSRVSQNAAQADQYLRKLDRKQPRATP